VRTSLDLLAYFNDKALSGVFMVVLVASFGIAMLVFGSFILLNEHTQLGLEQMALLSVTNITFFSSGCRGFMNEPFKC